MPGFHETKPAFRPGRIVEDRFAVLRILGRGGMGLALLARDLRDEGSVVLKVPHLVDHDAPLLRERFRREIGSLTRLAHPHIVRVLGSGEQDGIPFGVFEYLDGGTLDDRLRNLAGAAPEFDWLEPIADALDYVHGEGFLHRDVKPGNLLFEAAGRPRLADFGLVKTMAGTDLTLTGPGGFPGSPAYMAPEFLGGDVGPAYDQYSLAAVVVRCLSGASPVPFEVNLAVEDLAGRGLGPGARQVLLTALSMRPERRYPSCRVFARAFANAFAAGTTPGATEGEAGYDDPTRIYRRPGDR